MRAYIFFKTWRELPRFETVLNFVYGRSFRKRDDLGGYSYSRRFRQSNGAWIYWSKWLENPRVPKFTSFKVVHFKIFPPSNKSLRYGRGQVARGRSLGYGRCAAIWLGDGDGNGTRRPAMIDRRTFYRTVVFFARVLDGVILADGLKTPQTLTAFKRRHAKVIDRPFTPRLTPSDLHRRE